MTAAPGGWPRVSVIVPVYDDPVQLERCIAALHAQDYEGAVQLLVVDNGSDPPVPPRDDGVAVLREPRPGSYAARNTALRHADGRIVAFTDADCVPDPRWLRAAVAHLVREPGVAAVGGQVRIMPIGRERPSIAELYEVAVAFPQQSYIAQGGFAATANLVTWRSVIDAVGPFDATLRSGGDADWGQRLGRLGLRLAYCPEAIVDHPARSHREVMRKVRRTTGGSRDRDSGWRSCVRFCIRFTVPPRKRILAIAASRTVAISPLTRLRVIGYATLVNWAAVYHRLRLQVRDDASVR